MAEQALSEVATTGVQVKALPRERGPSGKKLVIFIALPVVLLLAAGAGVYFSGMLDSFLASSEAVPEEGNEVESIETAIFYDLPEMLVNLNSNGRSQSFLKLSVSLELRKDADRKLLEQVLPRIVDNFQVYLRELRIEDLSGSAGLQRLREELLTRVDAAVARPGLVKDVLFKEMLVQ